MKRSYEGDNDDELESRSKRAKIEASNQPELAIVDLPTDVICIIVSHLTYSQVVRLAVTNKRWYYGPFWNGLIDLTFIGERISENISNRQLNLALSKCDPRRLLRLQLIKCSNIDGKYLNSIINNYRGLNILVLSQCLNLGNSTDLLDAILKLPYLECLDLSQNTWLNENYFSERASRSIKSINLNGCTRITDDFIASMTVCCPNLESISLSGCFRLTDQTAIIISTKFPKIKQLDLAYCDNISDISVGHLTNAKNLRDLNVAHTAVTGSGIKAMAMSETTPDLSHLIISSLNKVDQDTTMQLTRFSSLKLLDITRNEILSMSTIASLVTFLPKLEMLYYSIGSFMRVADYESILKIRKNYLDDSNL